MRPRRLDVHLENVVISVQNDRTGPLRVAASSDTMPRKVLDPLRAAIRSVAILSDGMFWCARGFAVCLLQLLEEAISWQQAWYERIRPAVATTDWDTTGKSNWFSILGGSCGIDLSTIDDVAGHLLGELIADICSRVSQDIRILHVEPVFRSDLVSRHLQAKKRIHEGLLTLPRLQLRKSVA